jgi:hypothetical protein
LRNILLLKFTLLGITLIIVLAHQSYMGARGSCRYVYHLFAYVVAHEVDYPDGVFERDLNNDIVVEEGGWLIEGRI